MSFTANISRPMTIAQIAGQGEKAFETGQRVQVVRFRRAAEMASKLEDNDIRVYKMETYRIYGKEIDKFFGKTATLIKLVS